MNIPQTVVKRPVATVTILLIVLVIGIVSLVQTPLDLLPDINPPFLAVITAFPGSSPQENLNMVTIPIEENLSAISGVKNIQSISQEHTSLVVLEFNWGADLSRLREEISARLDLLSLPDGVQRPIIVEFDPTLLPIMQLSVSGDEEMDEMTRRLEDTVKPRLETVSGVASIEILGGSRSDYFVKLYPEKMQEGQISFNQIYNIMQASLIDLPAGIVELEELRMRLRIIGRSPGLEDLKKLVVGFNLDEKALESMVGGSIDINLNRLLSETLPPPESIQIPTRTYYVKDFFDNIEIDTDAGLFIIMPDNELLDRYHLSLEQAVDLMPEEWEAFVEDNLILIPLPPGDLGDTLADIRNTEIITLPDLEAMTANLERQLSENLDRASQQIEKALLEMAMAMALSSTVPGGAAAAIPEEDFPLIPVTLGSIADIREDYYPTNTINRDNGNASIGLSLQKEGEANTVMIAREIRETLKELEAEFNERGIAFNYHYRLDQAREIEIALADLAHALLMGSFLAVLILLLFLRNWRTILIIGLTIPTAVTVSFALLYFANLSINLMTLGALALAAGMLVDNAIVVSENIYRHLQLGSTPREAAVKGTREVTGAILASTLTTLSVFFPVVFLSGLAGELFREFALTVSCALLASFIIAISVIPMLASRFLKLKNNHAAVKQGPHHYRKIVKGALRYTWLVIGGSVAFLALGVLVILNLGTDLFPTPEESSFSIEIILPAGTTLRSTDSFTREMEELVSRQEGVRSFSTRVGESGFFGVSMDAGSTNRAQIRVVMEDRHKDKMDDIIAHLRKEADSILEEGEIFFQRESLLDATGLDVRVEIVIQGPELETIKELSTEVSKRLKQLPALTDINTALEDDRPEIHVELDQAKALQKGVTVFQVATMLNQALEGVEVARIEAPERVYNLILGYREQDIDSIEDIKNIGFYTDSGSYLQLGEVAEFRESFGPLNISRENRRIIGYVRAQYQGQDLSSVTREALDALDDMDLPPGYTISEAASSQMEDIFEELEIVLIVAAILVYLVMAAQFESFRNPFIIICSLPLAFTGGVLALWLTGSSLSVPAMIGAVVLAGILVNDGIIMVDFINQQRTIHGLSLENAIVTGASARLRPIIMITITTILGLVPLALGLGEGSQLQAPMAIVIIGGQITGTIFLLVVIPAVYYLINRPLSNRSIERA